MCDAKVHLKIAIEMMALPVEELHYDFYFLVDILFDDFPPEGNSNGLSRILPVKEHGSLITLKFKIDALIDNYSEGGKHTLVSNPAMISMILSDPVWTGVSQEAKRLKQIMHEYLDESDQSEKTNQVQVIEDFNLKN